MAIDGVYAGHILISDLMKPHAKEAVEALKQCRNQENCDVDR